MSLVTTTIKITQHIDNHDRPVKMDVSYEERARKWLQINTKKYTDKRKFGHAEQPKADMPPEHLRYGSLVLF